MRTFFAVFLLAACASTASAVPISEALSCGRSGEAGGLPAGTDLTRVTVDVSRFPNAVCNDGTPAVFYAAPYTRAEDRDKWVILLQGGGGCRSGQACAQRWCSSGTNFGKDKMTTSLSKPSIRGDGILSSRAANPFATWNRVLIYYCSSDTWAGTRSVRLTAGNDVGTATVTYDIHFKGRYIVDAVLDTLRGDEQTRRRPVRRAAAASAQVSALPDLDDATDVLFGGSSAGGGGVRNNLDRVHQKLRSANTNCLSNPQCAFDFRGVIDATYGPNYENLDWRRTTMCAADPAACDYEQFFRREWNESLPQIWGFAGDSSCVEWHALHRPGTEWTCADDTHVIPNHLTTPMFVRLDLQDSLLTSNFVEAGFGTASDFGFLSERQLRALPDVVRTAEEPSAIVPAVYGPQCRHHESMTGNEAFFDVRVQANDGQNVTFADLLRNWWRGSGSIFAVRPFTAPGATAGCP